MHSKKNSIKKLHERSLFVLFCFSIQKTKNYFYNDKIWMLLNPFEKIKKESQVKTKVEILEDLNF